MWEMLPTMGLDPYSSLPSMGSPLAGLAMPPTAETSPLKASPLVKLFHQLHHRPAP